MQKPEPSADPIRMWWVSRPDGGGGHLFAGDLQSAVHHINDLHRQTGLQHATQEICVDPERDGSLRG